MTRDEFNSYINNVRTASDDVSRATALTQLIEGVNENFTEHDTVLQRNTQLEKENKDYIEVNNRLFLQVTNSNIETETSASDSNTPTQENIPPKMTFDELEF